MGFELFNFYLITVIVTTATVTEGHSSEDVRRLRTNLFTNYNKQVRPITNQSNSVNVSAEIYVMHIHDLDEKTQEFTFSAWIYMEWYDEFLRWDPDRYNGLSTLLAAPTEVWRPDIAISNSYERMTKYSSGDYLIRIDSDGKMDWSPGDIFKTFCTVDITFYPFDTQTCNISLGTWMYDATEVDLTPGGTVSLEDYSVSGEWDLISTNSFRKLEVFDCCPGERTVMLTFQMTMSRRRTFYVLTVIIPVLLFSFLNVVDFLLPPESGEKMSLSVTVFLSFAFFMSILNESMPRTSLSFSIIGIYMIVIMGMGTVSVLMSAIVLMIHHRGKGQTGNPTGTRQQNQSVRNPREMPPDFLPGIEQFDNLSEKLDGTFETGYPDDDRNSGNGTHACQKETDLESKITLTNHRTVKLARRLDRCFLWCSLALTICGAIAVMSVLSYH